MTGLNIPDCSTASAIFLGFHCCLVINPPLPPSSCCGIIINVLDPSGDIGTLNKVFLTTYFLPMVSDLVDNG